MPTGTVTSDEDESSGKYVYEVPAYIRTQFIQKVYSILVAQLLVTVAIATPIQFVSNDWLKKNIWLYWFAMFGSLFLILGMTCCCMQAAQRFPTNYLMVFGFTVLESIVVGFVSAMYKTESVVLAAGLTAGIFFGLTAFACFTKSDFTGCGPYLFAALWGLVLFSFVMGMASFFLEIPRVAHKIFGCLGAILFSFYIIYDTQLIVGGRHKRHEFTVDDYVFAALNLYLDIINLFMDILSLVGSRD